VFVAVDRAHIFSEPASRRFDRDFFDRHRDTADVASRATGEVDFYRLQNGSATEFRARCAAT